MNNIDQPLQNYELDDAVVHHMLQLVRYRFPAWDGFDMPAFLKDEVNYKQETADKLRSLLGEETLDDLLRQEAYDEIIDRAVKVAQSSNLLYLSVPLTSDIGILYDPQLDKVAFCRIFADLLYGPGSADVRLSRYLSWVESHQLPNKWTFPTYYLFFCHPETELFVKPSVIQWWLKYVKSDVRYHSTPSVELYQLLKAQSRSLWRKLHSYQPTDMIDIQSFIWVCNRVEDELKQRGESLPRTDGAPRYWKIAPGEGAWQWEEWRDKSIIAIGWDLLGDLRQMTRQGYEERRDELAREKPDYKAQGMDQVRRFAQEIQVGDRVIANRGFSEVLGIGTVTGDYFYEPTLRHPHRKTVRWDDLTPRQVDQRGWRQTLVPLSKEVFNSIVDGPAMAEQPLLASPFDEIFGEYDWADTVFDFLHEALELFGATGPDDPRFALTLPKSHYPNLLRLNFGQWVVIDVRGPEAYSGQGLSLALLIDETDLDTKFNSWGKFKQAEGEKPLGIIEFPVEFFTQAGDDFVDLWERSTRYIGTLFAHWTGCPYRHAHQQAIFEAIWEPTKRASLLNNGLQIDPASQQDETEIDPPSEVQEGAHPDSAFSTRSFDLLWQIHEDPTLAFYQTHKEEFVTHVEESFKRVLRSVAARLPTSICQSMETEKRLFARFPKNDFGQGGTWDFYWGAFYPKGSKRSMDAQLSMWMNHAFLEFGFFIGHYGSEQRRRFERNCARHLETLKHILVDALSDAHFFFGSQDQFQVQADGTIVHPEGRSWQDFLADPAAANCDVSYVIPRRDLLQMSADELVDTVLKTHIRLFPLVLLAIKDDPLPTIHAYYEEIDVDVDADEEAEDLTPIPYDRENFLADTFLAVDKALELCELLRDRKQMILYGPPGTGKSFVAQYLAKWLTNLADPSPDRVEMVQFHPAYGYEDFIEGIRAESFETQDGHHAVSYPTRPGLFVQFCRRAALADANQPHVFIIDEINRGNIARIFGELMLLLEYRDRTVPLPYSGDRFTIPSNVYLIGTMNTADRSIALVDFALRRRFHFAHFAADPDLFARWLASNPVEPAYLEPLYRRLATEAIDDPNFAIGPSYFMQRDLTEGKLERIWRYSIEPYLSEYYIDQPEKAAVWRWDGDIVKGLRGQA